MLTKCAICAVPSRECIPSPSGFFREAWYCRTCLSDAEVRCSHCDSLFDIHTPLPEPLDDQSFLCLKCDTQLLEELDDFTDNFESYTEGPGGTPWYNHRLQASPHQ